MSGQVQPNTTPDPDGPTPVNVQAYTAPPPPPILLFTVMLAEDTPPLYVVGNSFASVVGKLGAQGVVPQAIVTVGPVWLAFD